MTPASPVRREHSGVRARSRLPNATGGYSGLRQPGGTFVTLHIAGPVVSGTFDNGVSSGNMVGGVCGA